MIQKNIPVKHFYQYYHKLDKQKPIKNTVRHINIHFLKPRNMSGPSIKHKRKKRWNPKHPAVINCILKQVQYKHFMMLDVDSNLIAIDNHSPCCISNDVSDYITTLTPRKIKIKGFQ